MRNGHGFCQVARQEQVQRFFGGFQTPGGIEPRAELEADLVGAQRCCSLGDLFQRDEAGSSSRIQPFEPGGNQNAIFARQRHNVGDGSQRNQVKQRPQIEISGAGQTGFAPTLDQGMGKFEGQADGAEFGKRKPGIRGPRSWIGRD